MRMSDPVAHAQEEGKLAAQVQGRGVQVNGGAVHILHDEIGLALRGMAGIDHAGDTGMIEIGKKLAFPEETVAPRGPAGSGVEDLDGNLLLNLAVSALGQIDCAHATGAEQADESIGSAV